MTPTDKLREIFRTNEKYALLWMDKDKAEMTGELIASIKALIGEVIGETKIMSDENIEKSPYPNYARPYNQGRFDTVMEQRERWGI